MTSDEYTELAKNSSPEAFHVIHTEREKAMISSGGRIKEPSVVCEKCPGMTWLGLTKNYK